MEDVLKPPRVDPKRLVLFLLVFAAVAALSVGYLQVTSICDERERAAFVALRHVQGAELEPSGNWDADSCAAEYESSEAVESVVALYQDELRRLDWTNAVVTDQSGSDSIGQHMTSFDLAAERGSLWFEAYVWSYDHTRTTHVTVHVSDE